MCVCVSEYVCVHVCVRARVYVRLRVCVFAQVFAKPVLIMTALFSPLYEEMCLEKANQTESWSVFG